MEYSTLELLDKQIAVNRSAAIVVTITGAVTTAAALGLALLLIKSKNAISLIMAFFTIAMLPQMRFLAHNLLNMQECRKRKKALQNLCRAFFIPHICHQTVRSHPSTDKSRKTESCKRNRYKTTSTRRIALCPYYKISWLSTPHSAKNHP